MSEPIGVIRAERTTFLKKELIQALDLHDSEKAFLKEGEELRILAFDQTPAKDHYLVTLDENVSTMDDSNKFNTWYIYVPPDDKESFWTIIEDNRPAPSEALRHASSENDGDGDLGKIVQIPGRGRVGLNQPILKSHPWASWGEATHGGTRMPESEAVVAAIERITRDVQPIRDKFGALLVNSWYRPPHINRAVGGASRSRHIVGDAVDVRPASGRIWEMQEYCVKHWGKKGGVGRGASRGFIHLDSRGAPKTVWNY